jgi:hypothetical protein
VRKEMLDHPKLGTHEVPSLVKTGMHLFCLHENGILVFDLDRFKVLKRRLFIVGLSLKR